MAIRIVMNWVMVDDNTLANATLYGGVVRTGTRVSAHLKFGNFTRTTTRAKGEKTLKFGHFTRITPEPGVHESPYPPGYTSAIFLCVAKYHSFAFSWWHFYTPLTVMGDTPFSSCRPRLILSNEKVAVSTQISPSCFTGACV